MALAKDKYAHLTLYVILFISFMSSTVISTNPACNKMVHDSLRSSFDTPSPHLNWSSSDDCCHWEGITCDRAGRITQLSLPFKGLRLKAQNIFQPSFLGNLSHLTQINLSHNSIYGSLDQTRFLSSLSHLEILDLSYNLLSGELPFSPLSSNIWMLDLSSNHFHGAITSSLFQQAKHLTCFSVRNNTFSGSIPSSICHSAPLIQLLDFSFNDFNGNISGGLGKCSKLRIFRAGHNNLSGGLPDDIYNATKIKEISLYQNSLNGNINESIGNLTHLKILDFSSNWLSGMLPRSLGKLSKLEFLHLRFNNLIGFYPSSLMNCTNLSELVLGFNNMTGNISTLNFSKLSKLTKLDIGNNHFTGSFPTSIYSCKSLKAIRLTSNDLLPGQIKPEILSLTSLSFLSLGYIGLTNITGAMKILMHSKSLVFIALPGSFVGEKIPKDIDMDDSDGFQNVRLLSFANSGLTGQLPAYLSKLKKMEALLLNNNRIRGPIPSWFGTLPSLQHLDLSLNLLSGKIPKELCDLPRLVSERSAARVDNDDLGLPIFGNRGSVYVVIVSEYALPFFPPTIDISNNIISGEVPSEIGGLQLLHELNLGNNNFSGKIPDQISKLKNLEQLDLSKNNFSGKIPSSFSSLNFLRYLNLSYNNLEGSIPTSTQLQSFDSSFFEGNPKLCGAPLPHKCLAIKGTNDDKTKKQKYVEKGGRIEIPWFPTSPVLGFIVGFLGVCGSLVIQKKWRWAYFGFVESLQDKFYVVCMVTLHKRLKRGLRTVRS